MTTPDQNFAAPASLVEVGATDGSDTPVWVSTVLGGIRRVSVAPGVSDNLAGEGCGKTEAQGGRGGGQVRARHRVTHTGQRDGGQGLLVCPKCRGSRDMQRDTQSWGDDTSSLCSCRLVSLRRRYHGRWRHPCPDAGAPLTPPLESEMHFQ